jgi:hypothetical protein
MRCEMTKQFQLTRLIKSKGVIFQFVTSDCTDCLLLCNKIYKRYFSHEFYVRHERSVAERVFNKQVSREVYKRVEYYTFFTTKLTNGTHKRNKQLFY